VFAGGDLEDGGWMPGLSKKITHILKQFQFLDFKNVVTTDRTKQSRER
jgi:hypothetical protein